MTEELALQHAAGERGTVHSHERPVRARARGMNHASDQLLAGAALATQQHRRRGRRHPAHQFERSGQRRCLSYDLGPVPGDVLFTFEVLVVPREPFDESPVLDDQVMLLDGLLDRAAQIGRVKWLLHVTIDQARIDRFGQHRDVAVRGEQHAHGIRS